MQTFLLHCALHCLYFVKPHLAPLADSPLRAHLVIAGLRDHPLVLTAFPVHQAPAQIVHTERIPATDPMPACFGALRVKTRNDLVHLILHIFKL